jgi:hypothetical protein
MTSRSVIGSAAAVTSVILAVTAWGLSREPAPLASYRLADGTVLRLEAVTRGPVHRVVVGPNWQRLLAWLPFPALRKLSSDAVHEVRGTAPNSLIFWTSQAAGPHEINLGAEVINERGDFYSTNPQDAALVGNRLLLGFEAPVVSRRGKRLGLRLAVDWGPNVAGELLTDNRWPGPFPSWRPERLPITKQNGQLRVTLTSLTTHFEVLHSTTTTFPDIPAFSEAYLQCTWHGRPSSDWLPVGVTLRDPTGNLLTLSGSTQGWRGDKLDYSFSPTFWADEPIWKLRLELVPCTPASINPADLWSIPSLPIPPRNVYSRTAARFSRHGVTVRIRDIAGLGVWERLGHGHVSSPGTTVHLKSNLPVRGLHLLLIRAVDDRGRSVSRVDDWGFTTQPPGTDSTDASDGEHSFELRPAPGAKSVKLLFALVKSRFVEFVVRPTHA